MSTHLWWESNFLSVIGDDWEGTILQRDRLKSKVFPQNMVLTNQVDKRLPSNKRQSRHFTAG